MWWCEDKGQVVLLSLLSGPLAVETTFPTAWSLPVLLKSAAGVTFCSLVGGGGPVVVPGWFSQTSGLTDATVTPTKFLSLSLSNHWSCCFTLQLMVWNGHSGPPWRPNGTIIVSQLGCPSSFSHQHHAPRNRQSSSYIPCTILSTWYIGGREVPLWVSISCFKPLPLWTKD